MFKLAKDRKVWWPVKLSSYNADGEPSTTEIRVLIRLMPRAEREAITQRELESLKQSAIDLQSKADTPEQMAAQAADRALRQSAERTKREAKNIDELCERVLDWRGVTDEATGDAVPFSAALLRDLLAYEDVLTAFTAAFAEASRGAVTKN